MILYKAEGFTDSERMEDTEMYGGGIREDMVDGGAGSGGWARVCSLGGSEALGW